MNAPVSSGLKPTQQDEAQLAATLKGTWDNLAGVIRRRITGILDVDKFISKAKESLFCALMGTSKKRFYDSGGRLSVSEMEALLSVYNDLIDSIKGQPDDPGLPSEYIDNEIGIRLIYLKQQRAENMMEATQPKIESPKISGETAKKVVDRVPYCLPPIGTTVWYGDIPFEVVPAARLKIVANGKTRYYRPRNGRALLCLQGVRAGAFNSSPTALVRSIDGKDHCGWHVMRFSPSQLGTGLLSELAEAVLNSGKAYVCELVGVTSAGYVYPDPVPELQALMAQYSLFSLSSDEVVLSQYKEPSKETPAPVPSPAPVPAPAPKVPATAAFDFSPLLAKLRQLQSAVFEFKNSKEHLHQAVLGENKKLFDELQDKKITMIAFAKKFAELEQMEQEFERL